MSDTLIQRALKVLQYGPCVTREFLDTVLAGSTDWKKQDNTNLGSRLRKLGLIRLSDGKYYITDAGRVKLGASEHVSGARQSKMGGDYDCPELGDTCCRPGAYDYRLIPSVFGSERREYKFRSGV